MTFFLMLMVLTLQSLRLARLQAQKASHRPEGGHRGHVADAEKEKQPTIVLAVTQIFV